MRPLWGVAPSRTPTQTPLLITPEYSLLRNAVAFEELGKGGVDPREPAGMITVVGLLGGSVPVRQWYGGYEPSGGAIGIQSGQLGPCSPDAVPSTPPGPPAQRG